VAKQLILIDIDGIPKLLVYIKNVEPRGYLGFIFLVKRALGVITDSWGSTEETTVMGVPCITFYDSIERPERVKIGTNKLIGTNPDNLTPFQEQTICGTWKKGSTLELWDGKAAERIVQIMMRFSP
jgi:UDP-N-acetylglucosamine 2-epimerase (non-hydrolysing)